MTWRAETDLASGKGLPPEIRPHNNPPNAFHAREQRRLHRPREVVHERHVRRCPCHCLKAKAYQCSEMASDLREWDAAGLEISGIERAFVAPSSNDDDAAESSGGLEEEQKGCGEAHAGVVS